MQLPLQPEPVVIQKPSTRGEKLNKPTLVSGHQVIPDDKEDGRHGDDKKRKGSVEVQHAGCDHQQQIACPGGRHRHETSPCHQLDPQSAAGGEGSARKPSHSCALTFAFFGSPEVLEILSVSLGGQGKKSFPTGPSSV